jgi:hypothetical protein
MRQVKMSQTWQHCWQRHAKLPTTWNVDVQQTEGIRKIEMREGPKHAVHSGLAGTSQACTHPHTPRHGQMLQLRERCDGWSKSACALVTAHHAPQLQPQQALHLRERGHKLLDRGVVCSMVMVVSAADV